MKALFPILFVATTALANPPEPQFRAQTVDDQVEIGYGVAAADVDGDGKTDLLLADKRRFVWYRNPTWERFVLAENLTKRDNVCLAAQDIDGDGKCEIAVGGDWDPSDRENSGAVFYLIAPEDRTQRWEPVKLHAEPTVHRMRWVELEPKRWGLVVVPLHGRGPAEDTGSKVLLYHVPPDARGEWTTEVLDDTMHQTHNFDVLPGPAILLAGREGAVEIKRDASGAWSKTWRVQGVGKPGEIRAAEGQALLAAVEPMHGNELAIYSGVGRTVLTDQMVEGHALAVADLFGDARQEIVVGWRGRSPNQPHRVGVRVFSAADGARWREGVLDDKGMACEDLCVADLNGDGRPDVVASGRRTKNVVIYWNETPAE